MIGGRPNVMSIAGFDPSGGAGVLADVKTFEQLKLYGLGVLTANTIQSDIQVHTVNWLPTDNILAQAEVLLDRFAIDYFKIGIVQNAQVLASLIAYLKKRNSGAKIIWDPVLQATSGFRFFQNQSDIEALLPEIYLVTPNIPEFLILFKDGENALWLSKYTQIYLKGGHRECSRGLDILYTKGKVYNFLPEVKEVWPKHGSGCILSSAICGYLALGYPLPEACQKGKRYIENVLTSNPSLLSWHNYE